jgi:hypothetical protein
MGYNVFVFKLQVQPWLDAGWRKPGARLLGFGAREFTPDAAELYRERRAFLGAQARLS